MPDREPGLYWVRRDEPALVTPSDGWEVAHFHDGEWDIWGHDIPVLDDFFAQIGERAERVSKQAMAELTEWARENIDPEEFIEAAAGPASTAPFLADRFDTLESRVSALEERVGIQSELPLPRLLARARQIARAGGDDHPLHAILRRFRTVPAGPERDDYVVTIRRFCGLPPKGAS